MNSPVIVMAMALVFCQVAVHGDHLDSEDARIARAVTTRRGKLVPFLEKFKTILQTGNDTLGIPVMDPFVSVQEHLSLEADDINIKALLTNIKATGLSSYNIVEGDFSFIGMRVVIRLRWPLLQGESDYILKGNALGFSLYGHGNASAALKNLYVSVTLGFSMANNGLYVQYIYSRITLEALDFKATGLLDDEEMSAMLSKVISDTAPQLVEDYQELITGMLNDKITNTLNNFLKDKTLSEILAMFS